jgi:hypothetical protein
MSFAIPKIEYKNGSTTGDTTITSPVLANVPDTTNVEAGMFVTGTGVPAGTTVLSTTADSITMSANATATASDIAIAYGFKIEFDYPPVEKDGERRKTNATTTTSLSGINQVSVNYIEGLRKLDFSFLTHALYLLVKTFLDSHALSGNSFRYFEDKTTTTYVEYELEKLDVTPKKIASRGVDTYIWEIPLEIRRVIS